MGNNLLEEVEEGLGKELINRNSDTLIDYGEMLLKDIFNSDVIDQIPVIKTIAAFSKTGLAIKERFFAKKLINFLNTYQLGYIDESELDSFKVKMEDANYKSKVIETIMVYLDRYNDTYKAILISKVFIGYIQSKYNWDKFVLFCNCIDLLLINDLKILNEAALTRNEDGGINNITSTENIGTMTRLENIGFLISEGIYGLVFGTAPITNIYKISADGNLFLQTINNNY
jgi:hypothetical protein